MGKWIAIGALTLLPLMTSSPARAELWCVRAFHSPHRACVFSSVQECFLAVRISGGICEREPDKRESKAAPVPRSSSRRPTYDR